MRVIPIADSSAPAASGCDEDTGVVRPVMLPLARPLHEAGFAMLFVDARCHGASDDDSFASLPRFAEDIAAGLAWLKHQPNIASDRVALLGHSVGAAAALLHAAHHDDVGAVVSLSAFAHPEEVMRRFMAEKRVPYPLLGWYVLRHVQKVIGTSFDDIAPLRTLAAVACCMRSISRRRLGRLVKGS